MSDTLSSAVLDQSTAQSDELEALYAIYEECFLYIEPENHIYAICIPSDGDRSMTIQFQYPDNYPTERLTYQLQAPWLRGPLFDQLVCELDQLVEQAGDEPVVHCLVEHIREFSNNQACKLELTVDDIGFIFDDYDMLDRIPARTVADNVVPSVRAHLDYLPGLMPVALNCEDVVIHHGEPFVDRRSVFQAHLCRADSMGQVSRFISALLTDRKVAVATHNILAWRVTVPPLPGQANVERIYSDCDDDGEVHAGSRLLHLLTVSGAKNVCIIVSRWYGGILLGPDRFKHINSVARQLLCSQSIIGSSSSAQAPNKEHSGRTSKRKR